MFMEKILGQAGTWTPDLSHAGRVLYQLSNLAAGINPAEPSIYSGIAVMVNLVTVHSTNT